jgi:hypothetical protein
MSSKELKELLSTKPQTTPKSKQRVLTPYEQDLLCELMVAMMPAKKIWKIMHISPTAITNTRRADPNFDRKLHDIRWTLGSKLELLAWRTALYGNKSVRTIYQYCVDKDGNQVLTKHGKPKRYITRREVTVSDCSESMMRFLLATQFPEVYGSRIGTPDWSNDDIRVILQNKINEMNSSKKMKNLGKSVTTVEIDKPMPALEEHEPDTA